MLQSRYRRAVHVARRAIAEQAELTDQRAAHLDPSGAINALGVSLAAIGRDRRGRRRAAAARSTRRTGAGTSTTSPRASANLSEVLHHVGRTAEALECARVAHAQLGSLPARQLWLSNAIAQYAFDAGDWEEAERALAGISRRRFASGNAELNSCLRRAELALGATSGRRRRSSSTRARRAGGRLARAAVPRRAGRAAGRAGDARGRRRSALAPRSSWRSTGSSSAPTTRCGWRWRPAPG